MKKTLAILALGLTAIAGHAATPLWMRDVQISPDGTEIAFCYKGDIYKVPAKGGTATQLTTQESYECTQKGTSVEYKGKKYPSFLFKKGRPVPEFRRYLQIEKLFIS